MNKKILTIAFYFVLAFNLIAQNAIHETYNRILDGDEPNARHRYNQIQKNQDTSLTKKDSYTLDLVEYFFAEIDGDKAGAEYFLTRINSRICEVNWFKGIFLQAKLKPIFRMTFRTKEKIAIKKLETMDKADLEYSSASPKLLVSPSQSKLTQIGNTLKTETWLENFIDSIRIDYPELIASFKTDILENESVKTHFTDTATNWETLYDVMILSHIILENTIIKEPPLKLTLLIECKKGTASNNRTEYDGREGIISRKYLKVDSSTHVISIPKGWEMTKEEMIYVKLEKLKRMWKEIARNHIPLEINFAVTSWDKSYDEYIMNFSTPEQLKISK